MSNSTYIPDYDDGQELAENHQEAELYYFEQEQKNGNQKSRTEESEVEIGHSRAERGGEDLQRIAASIRLGRQGWFD